MPATPFVAAKSMQTKSAEKRSQRIEDDYKKKKAELKKAQDRYRAAKKKAKKKGKAVKMPPQPHADSAKELTGVLAKDAYYAQNCHDYLKGNAGRHTVTLNFDVNFASKHRGLAVSTLQYFKFPLPGVRDENFNPSAKNKRTVKKAGQRFPYAWEAHHMLPGSAFYYQGPDGHCFEPWQIQL
ncbi:MAG TPA: hypothetical protein VND93_05770, partial [Myxococcales bacterium]|nr:hypothetical protein [Myxococcales bacterium]